MTDEEHIEATLINIYAKQLNADSGWSQENGMVKYNLTFEKSEQKDSLALSRKGSLN
jgi:hypothetical protein